MEGERRRKNNHNELNISQTQGRHVEEAGKIHRKNTHKKSLMRVGKLRPREAGKMGVKGQDKENEEERKSEQDEQHEEEGEKGVEEECKSCDRKVREENNQKTKIMIRRIIKNRVKEQEDEEGG